MTLRDAIREMVRWCQMTRPELQERWCDRTVFRMDLAFTASWLLSNPWRCDSCRAMDAARIVNGALGPRLVDRWVPATRAVWVTL